MMTSLGYFALYFSFRPRGVVLILDQPVQGQSVCGCQWTKVFHSVSYAKCFIMIHEPTTGSNPRQELHNEDPHSNVQLLTMCTTTRYILTFTLLFLNKQKFIKVFNIFPF